MKKLLIVLMLWLGCFIQTNSQVTYAYTMYLDWTLVGTPSWTTPSWFYCVTRSTYVDRYGNYYYDVWFTSNTNTWDYYNNRGSWRYVQMNNCKVTYDGNYANYGKPISFSFLKDYPPTALRYITKNKYPKFGMSWGGYYTL